jgi:hypothetical protein
MMVTGAVMLHLITNSHPAMVSTDKHSFGTLLASAA